MNKDTKTIPIKIEAILSTDDVLDVIRSESIKMPDVPTGDNNTHINSRYRADGRYCAIVVQRSFEQTNDEEERGEEVNGLSMITLNEEPTHENMIALEQYVADTLGK